MRTLYYLPGPPSDEDPIDDHQPANENPPTSESIVAALWELARGEYELYHDADADNRDILGDSYWQIRAAIAVIEQDDWRVKIDRIQEQTV